MIDKNITIWYESIKNKIINFYPEYDENFILEALKYLDKNDIGLLNNYIYLDKDKISSYKKDTLTYSKILYYANKLSNEKMIRQIKNLDLHIQNLIQKRDFIIPIIDDKNNSTLGYKQSFISKFDEAKTNIFIDKKAYLSKKDKEIIKLFGVNLFFDSDFNFETTKRLEGCFIKHKKNDIIKLSFNDNSNSNNKQTNKKQSAKEKIQAKENAKMLTLENNKNQQLGNKQ
jgi:hypothetical protein